MKYAQFRIAIFTCVFGLISVPFFNGLYEKWSEPFINLPKVESDSPIIVIVPTERNSMPDGGGGSASGARGS